MLASTNSDARARRMRWNSVESRTAIATRAYPPCLMGVSTPAPSMPAAWPPRVARARGLLLRTELHTLLFASLESLGGGISLFVGKGPGFAAGDAHDFN